MIDIFFDIVFAAVIFSRMGDGKNSGNLIFKKIFSGSNFNIIDGETGITFSSTGSGVETDKIAWGTGTSITSSSFYVYTTTYKESILGLSSIRNDHDLKKASYATGNGSFIAGGESNNISGSSIRSTILGGKTHSIVNSDSSVILAGCDNCIEGCQINTVIGGHKNKLKSSFYSSVISSASSSINCNKFSSIISSKSSDISGSQPDGYNSHNIIISSFQNIIYNKSKLGVNGQNLAYLKSNSILASNISCITLEYKRGKNEDEVVNPGDHVQLNTILSSKKSCINNKYTGPNKTTNYNLVFASRDANMSSNFSSISGRYNRVKSYDYDKFVPSTFGKYSQILGGCGNYIRTYMSSIISSVGSTMSAGRVIDSSVKFNQIIGGSNHCINYVANKNGDVCGMHYTSIIGGCNNKISSLTYLEGKETGTHFSTILGGNNNCVNGWSIIVGGTCNKTGYGYNVPDAPGSEEQLEIFGATVSRPNCYRSGMIFGGYKNSAFGFSTVIGGSNNESIKRGSIVGGCKNCSGFQYNQSYQPVTESGGAGLFDEPGFLQLFHGTNSRHNSFILGGCNNCTTSDLMSVIMGGFNNVTRNVNDSVIIGGSCNHIKAHGDFSGISGLSHSEVSALWALNQASKPFFDISQKFGHLGNTSWPSTASFYCMQTQVSHNFIIGGKCNRFKSCFPNNYDFSGPYGYQWYNKTFTLPDYGPAGLSNSSTSFVANSGIVGGYRNCILNTYNLMGGTGSTIIAGSSGKYGGMLINSVILGGQNLIMSKSNMVCASESILVGTVSIADPVGGGGGSCNGVSGTFTDPKYICVVGGIVTEVG